MDALFGEGAASGAYRVLARKYRPHGFEDLIGQEPMVRTLSNAFAASRVHQAYIFTGVRGVGKTTTARILARGLNYETDTVSAPTVHMPALGRHCQAIMESRHVDVLEMDAASNTGIDNVREIIESARYKPVSARTKVYIIDEVHMLSTQAFNGLLKTLEEPPEHVKFLFATTEIRKVPITVLSRCIRFDLRRVEAATLIAHLGRICEREGVAVEAEALAVIARASEGSVRDALSLLDRAMAHGGELGGELGEELGVAAPVTADAVRAMLGLADRARVIDLFEALMRGDMPAALAEMRVQDEGGADPAALVADLADYVHFVTRLKLSPEAARDPAVSEAERVRGEGFARALSMRVLTRAWQILLKGVADVQGAPRPFAAAEMVLVRLAFAADLPTPDDALRMLTQDAPGQTSVALAHQTAPVASPPAPTGAGAPVARMRLAPSAQERPRALPQPAAEPDAPAVTVASLTDLVALAIAKRDIGLKVAIERDIRLVRLEPGILEFSLAPSGAQDLPTKLSRALQGWTGARWMVALSSEAGQPTLREEEEAREAEAMRGVRADPTVRAILERFPGAEIVAVRAAVAEPAEDAAPAPSSSDPDRPAFADDDLVYDDGDFTDDDL